VVLVSLQRSSSRKALDDSIDTRITEIGLVEPKLYKFQDLPFTTRYHRVNLKFNSSDMIGRLSRVLKLHGRTIEIRKLKYLTNYKSVEYVLYMNRKDFRRSIHS
jgi:hypothetical protein